MSIPISAITAAALRLTPSGLRPALLAWYLSPILALTYPSAICEREAFPLHMKSIVRLLPDPLSLLLVM